MQSTPQPTLKSDNSVQTPTPTPKWELSDRLAWALGLKVSSHVKLVAVAIASHAGASSGLCWPGMGLLVEETGLSRSSVIRGIAELERGEHLTVTRLKIGKKNAANRYRLPAMGCAAETPPSVCVTPPPSVCVTPEPVRTLEPVKNKAPRAREVCKICGHSWPKDCGSECYRCLQAGPSADDRRQARFNASKAKFLARTKATPDEGMEKFIQKTGGRPGRTEARSEVIDAARLARIRADRAKTAGAQSEAEPQRGKL